MARTRKAKTPSTARPPRSSIGRGILERGWSSPVRPNPGTGTGNGASQVQDTPGPNPFQTPGTSAAVTINSSAHAKQQALVIFAKKLARKKGLKGQYKSALMNFASMDSGSQKVALMAEFQFFALRYVKDPKDWTPNNDVKKELKALSWAVLLSPHQANYKGDTVAQVMDSLEELGSNGLDENWTDYDSMREKMSALVSRNLNTIRSELKTTVFSSVDERKKQSLNKLLDVLFRHCKTLKPHMGHFGRFALLRMIAREFIATGDSSNFWDGVDEYLIELREKATTLAMERSGSHTVTEAEIQARIKMKIEDIVAEDRAKYGGKKAPSNVNIGTFQSVTEKYSRSTGEEKAPQENAASESQNGVHGEHGGGNEGGEDEDDEEEDNDDDDNTDDDDDDDTDDSDSTDGE